MQRSEYLFVCKYFYKFKLFFKGIKNIVSQKMDNKWFNRLGVSIFAS